MTGPCAFCGVPMTQGSSPPRGPVASRIDVDPRVCGACLTLAPARPGALLRAAALVAGGSEHNSYLLAAVAEDDAALDGLLFSDPSDPQRSAGRAPGEAWAHVPAATRIALEAARERASEAWLAADNGLEAAGEGAPPHGPESPWV